MAKIKYAVALNPGKQHKQGCPPLHFRPANLDLVDSDQLFERIHQKCTLTIPDMMSVMQALKEEIIASLLEGSRVHLKGIGYFYPQLTGKFYEKDGHFRPYNVDFRGIRIQADSELKKELQERFAALQPDGKHGSMFERYPLLGKGTISEAEIERRLTEYFSTHESITRMELRNLLGLVISRHYATDLLKRYAAEGRLKNISTLRRPVYVPMPGHYGRSKE